MKATFENEITHEVENEIEFRDAVIKAIELGVKEKKQLYYSIYSRDNAVCYVIHTEENPIASIQICADSFDVEDACTGFFLNYFRAHAEDYLEEK